MQKVQGFLAQDRVLRQLQRVWCTLLDSNCKKFEFQANGIFYVALRQSLLALKLKMIKSCGYETYNTKKAEKEHKDESKDDAAEDTADEEKEEVPPVSLVTLVNNIFFSIFLRSMYTSSISKSTPLLDCMRTSLTFPTIADHFYLSMNEFCTAGDRTIQNVSMRLWTLLSETFFTIRMNRLSRPEGFLLYDKFVIDYFCTSEWLHHNQLRLTRTRANFYACNNFSDLVLELLIARLTLVVLLSTIIIRGKNWTWLYILL